MSGDKVYVKREIITMGESLGISDRTETGSSDVFSGGIVDIKIEGYWVG